MNTLSTITILPSTKEEIVGYCQNVKDEILSGNENPLKLLKQLKAFEIVIKTLLSDKEIKSYMIDEASKYSERTFSYDGCKFQLKNSPAKWDYSECNDSEYEQMLKKKALLNEQIKGREKFLQGLKDGYINEDTGEVITPPLKCQSETIAVTLK